MELAIITTGYMPVPAVKGGAVETLIHNYITENECKQGFNITVFSAFDEKAEEKAKDFKSTKFIFYKTNICIKLIDKLVYFTAKNIFKKERTQSYRYIFQRLNFLYKVSKNLKLNNYDLVLLENHPALFLCLKFKKNYIKYSGKYIYHIHNEITSDFGLKKIIANSKAIICVSEFVAKQSQQLLKIETSRYYVVKNGVDISRFFRERNLKEIEETKKKLNINRKKVLLYTGRFTREKGILVLLEAIKKIKDKNIVLIIAGGFFFDTKIKNSDAQAIKKLLDNLGKKVINMGFVDYNEIDKLYQIADISVQPSVCNDSAPLTIIESMAAGLPVISTYSGGIPEYVTEKCAVLLNRDDALVENLQKAILSLINNVEMIKNMSIESRKLSGKYSTSNYYKNLSNVLKGCVEKNE